MRIKLDENIPAGLVAVLGDLGHDVDTVAGEGMRGRDDAAIWNASQSAGRFLITQDLDFSDVRRYEPGTNCGVLLVRLADPGRETLMRRLGAVFPDAATCDWERCFVVVTERKIRIRRRTRH